MAYSHKNLLIDSYNDCLKNNHNKHNRQPSRNDLTQAILLRAPVKGKYVAKLISGKALLSGSDVKDKSGSYAKTRSLVLEFLISKMDKRYNTVGKYLMSIGL